MSKRKNNVSKLKNIMKKQQLEVKNVPKLKQKCQEEIKLSQNKKYLEKNVSKLK